MLYFTTWLRQRGTTQSAVSKVFSLFGTQLQLVQQSSYNSLVAGTPFYARPSVSGDGTILAINWNDYCFGGSECLLQDTNSTVIHTPTGTLSYPGRPT